MNNVLLQQLSKSAQEYLRCGFYSAYCETQLELADAYLTESMYASALIHFIDAYRYSLIGFQSLSAYSMAKRDEFKTLQPQPTINIRSVNGIKSMITNLRLSWHDFSTVFKEHSMKHPVPIVLFTSNDYINILDYYFHSNTTNIELLIDKSVADFCTSDGTEE